MKKIMLVMSMALALAMSTMAGAFASLSQDIIYEQDFTADVTDWSTATHNATDGTATIEGSSYSYFGGTAAPGTTYRETWPTLGYVTELDVYVDPDAMAVGDGFDLTVASSRSDGTHLRDFIFHLGKTAAGDVLVNGSNNSDPYVNEYKLLNDGDGTPTTITDAGWYTFQHSFYDLSGSLAVDLNVLNASGDVIFTTTRNNADDLIAGVGGARYMWFTFVDGSFDIDNQLLAHNVEVPDAPSSKDECKAGGFKTFGFDNQGQCIASIQANENAGK